MALVVPHSSYPQFRVKKGVMPEFSGAAEVKGETPTGVFDGVNRKFTLKKTPISKSERVIKNGLEMKRDVDYTLLDKEVTFAGDQIPQGTSTNLFVDYKYMRESV